MKARAAFVGPADYRVLRGWRPGWDEELGCHLVRFRSRCVRGSRPRHGREDWREVEAFGLGAMLV